MKITLLVTGSLKEKYLKDAQDKILGNLLKKFGKGNVTIKEFKDLSINSTSPMEEERIKKEESKRIIEYLSKEDYLIALDIKGKKAKEETFGKLISKALDMGKENLVFVIGGSLGLSNDLLKKAQEKISFSDLTYPHQLFRIVLLKAMETYL